MKGTDGRQDISAALDEEGDEDDNSRSIITKDHDSARSKDLAAKFDAAVRVIQTIPNSSFQPSRELALRFYGLYKRATEGVCTSPKPAFYEVEKTVKWNAYKEADKLNEDQAKDEYVKELQKIVEMMSLTPEVSDFLDKLGSFYEMVNSSDEEAGVAVIARTTQLGNTLQDFKTINHPETAVRKKDKNNMADNHPSKTASLIQEVLTVVNSDDSVFNNIEEEEGSEVEDDKETVDSVETEMAFHDAHSLSEWSTSKHTGNRKETSDIMQMLYPELESLRKRTDEAEQTMVVCGQRLQAVESKLDKLGKAVAAISSANVGKRDERDSVLEKYFFFITSKVFRALETLPIGRSVVRLLCRYWEVVEEFVRRRPLTVLMIVWPILFQLLPRLLSHLI